MKQAISYQGRALPLVGVSVARVGGSWASGFLVWLLVSQGAVELGSVESSDKPPEAVSSADIVILDDVDELSTGHTREVLRTGNRRTVLCRFTNFPVGGPDWRPIADRAVSAALGLNLLRADSPVDDPLHTPSVFGGIVASIAIVAALEHPSGGLVDEIVVPLFSAAIAVLSRTLLRVHEGFPADPPTQPYLPLAEVFRCADGRFVQPHFGTNARFARLACTAGGHPEWGDQAAIGVCGLFADGAEEQRWRERFASMFLTQSADEWERRLSQLGGSCIRVRTVQEWATEDHAIESGVIVEAPTGLRQVGPAVCVWPPQNPPSPESGRAPVRRVTREEPPAGELPLHGLRVVDFCHVIAGPTCGRVLAELGADVIHVDMPDRMVNTEHWRDVYAWADVNTGKRSVVLDLKMIEGRRLARELCATADVVVENFRAGRMDQLKLGYESLIAENPRLIYATIDAFDADGAWEGRGGWEQSAQAATGMQATRMEQGLWPQVPYLINDNATGYIGALGILLALRNRRISGTGSLVRGSLARTATAAQYQVPHHSERKSGAVSSPIRCLDGWIRGRPDQITGDVGSECRELTSAAALELFASRGWDAVREASPQDLLSEAWVREAGLLRDWRHATLGNITQVTPGPATTSFLRLTRSEAPEPGEHTAAVLEELGYDAEDIERLRSNGAIQLRGPLTNGITKIPTHASHSG